MGRILSVPFCAQNARNLLKFANFPESKSPDHLKIGAHNKSSRRKQPAKRKFYQKSKKKLQINVL